MFTNKNNLPVNKINPKDWSQYKNLSDASKNALFSQPEFNKSRQINNLSRIAEQTMDKAKASGDRQKIRDADKFAANLVREERFIRHSK